MVTHAFRTYSLEKFWDDEYKTLPYIHEPFNDPASVTRWIELGFRSKITGALADMRGPQPSWNHRFVEFYESMGWKDVGTAYYCMSPGTVMPTHSDLYKAYIKRFKLYGQEHTIKRALVFLENWQPGHYLDCMGKAFVEWKAGDTVEWDYDTPHTAANIGFTDRYTLQITGHTE